MSETELSDHEKNKIKKILVVYREIRKDGVYDDSAAILTVAWALSK